MSDCGVCLGGYDGDGPSFYVTATKTARKNHICCECKEAIRPGDNYENITGRWDEIETFKTCLPCVAIREAFSCDGTWLFGSLWSDMREYVFPELTLSNKCLRELDTANRLRVIERWKRWKGVQ